MTSLLYHVGCRCKLNEMYRTDVYRHARHVIHDVRFRGPFRIIVLAAPNELARAEEIGIRCAGVFRPRPYDSFSGTTTGRVLYDSYVTGRRIIESTGVYSTVNNLVDQALRHVKIYRNQREQE